MIDKTIQGRKANGAMNRQEAAASLAQQFGPDGLLAVNNYGLGIRNVALIIALPLIA